MRISVIANDSEQSQLKKVELEALIEEKGIQLNSKHPTIVITIGGDGTLLSAFHRYAHQLDKIRFVGIHTGHLGFYTDWRDYELEELIDSLLSETGESVSYPLLEVQVTYQGERETKHFLALNESTIKRINGTMLGDVYIKNDLFEYFKGDGLAISTPTGSTAYNKSIGGAILHPNVNALQLTEIASINNRVYRTLGSPLVIANDEWITVKLLDDSSHLFSVDHLVMTEENIARIDYRIAKERIHFAAYRHTNFWNRVQDAFIKENET